jgi:hypothetical protein
VATYHSGTAVALYMATCALIGFIATAFMKDYSHKDISREYDHIGQKAAPNPGA